ncbi:class III lanthionine synthetase LanKC [Planotetraspora phitsanulokensis]|uniref:Serine/threonine protein kinase n=1 Tax=Planotetraspora phitsanulokensis TaxID=575192 RepID=A0A8J3UBQ8_9ACTN|nr:class III lanthionine synthetase LanKC [Planotetraspora phitsanulokensis]GII40411.1 serine/threonine protein kinase [Planotetraspora phitsanulokensis]
MEKRYELYCLADPTFYDSPVAGPDDPDFDLAHRTVPGGWARTRQPGTVAYRPVASAPPGEGWKIHVSARVDEAPQVLAKVGEYCLERELAFHFARTRSILHLNNAEHAAPGSSGTFLVVHPADEAELETALAELGDLLEGHRGPAVPGGLRCGGGPLYVRYDLDGEGGRAVLTRHDAAGPPKPPEHVFAPPSHVTPPAFLLPFTAARDHSASADLPYRLVKVLRRTNGCVVHLASDARTGEPVLLKEAHPHAGLDGTGADAVARLSHERQVLERLAGLGVAPELRAYFTLDDRHYLAMDLIPGEPLSEVFAGRHPLGGAGEVDLEGYVEWATEICAVVEDAVMKVHMNGLVLGDLDMSAFMVRPDGGVTLVGLDAARPVLEAAGTGLAGSGFGAPAGSVGFDVDRFALACLRFALFLPLTEMFLLDRGKAAELAEAIRRSFPLKEGFLRPAVRIVGGGETRDVPPLDDWRQMRSSMARAILASATPERTDRLFPGDIAQFESGGLGFAHGAAGVLYALHVTGAGRYPDHEEWLLSRALNGARGGRPGFYDGAHGIAHTLANLGHHQAALELVEASGRDRTAAPGIDLYGGLAGIGLNQIYLGEPDKALGTAGVVADRLAGGPPGGTGLMYGASGPALLFLRLYEKTGDVQWLDQAETALRLDLGRCAIQADGSLRVTEGRRVLTGLDRGSVGISWVLGEFLRYRADPELSAARQRLDRAARSLFHRHPGLFTGRAGALAYLCRDRAGGWGLEDPEAGRQLAALSWHSMTYQGHLAFPGERLLRLSMDLATGTAGVLLAVGGALHGEPVGLPFLSGAIPASRPDAAARETSRAERG